MMYDTLSGLMVCVLTNQLHGKAFQIVSQLIETIFSSTTALNENADTAIPVFAYPKPTNGEVTIVLGKSKLRVIKIFNANGELLACFNQKSIDISFPETGIYFLAVDLGDST